MAIHIRRSRFLVKLEIQRTSCKNSDCFVIPNMSISILRATRKGATRLGKEVTNR